MNRLAKFWPLLLFVVLAFAPLAKVLNGDTVGPHDQIQSMISDPVRAQTTFTRAWDVLDADSVLQSYVWRDLVSESWHRHQVPFWNTYALGGTPLLANSQSAALYPPHILIGLLGIPTALSVVLLAWFHLAWAGLGVYKVVRSLGGTRLGGTVAGLSFLLSPFMLGWTPLASVLTTVAWIPWVWNFLARLMQRQGPAASAFGGLAASVSLMLLGGHLQFAAYGVMASVLLALGLCLTRQGTWKSGGWVMVAVLIGGLASWPQVGPVLNFSKHSHRTGMAPDYAAYIAGAIQPWELANLVYPKVLGDPREPLLPKSDISSYWPPLSKRGANWAESAVTIGPVVVFGLVAIAAFWKKKPSGQVSAALVFGIAVVFLLLATGTPLNMLLYKGIPGWSATGSPGRAVSIFVLGCCVAAGLGLSGFEQRQISLRGLQLAAVSSVLLSLVPLSLSSFGPGKLANVPDQLWQAAYNGAAAAALIPALILAILGPQPALFIRMRQFPAGNVLWLAVVVLTSGLWGAFSIIPMSKPLVNDRYLNIEPGERIAAINQNWEIVTGVDANFPPNTLNLFRIRTIEGYDSLMARSSKDILDTISRGDAAPPANGNMTFVKPNFDAEALKAAGVNRVLTKSNGAVGEEIIGGHRIEARGGTASVSRDESGHIAIDLGGGVTDIIVRERNLPGWIARLDGKPVPIPSGEWIQLPTQGAKNLTLDYVAPGWMPAVGLLGWLIIGCCGFWSRRALSNGVLPKPSPETS